jgi:hypothetical protein
MGGDAMDATASSLALSPGWAPAQRRARHHVRAVYPAETFDAGLNTRNKPSREISFNSGTSPGRAMGTL